MEMKKTRENSSYIRVVHMAPLQTGGITSMVLNLAEELAQTEVVFDYLTFREQEELNEKRALSYGGKKLVVPKDRYKNILIRAVYKFVKTIAVLKKEEADIIHINASFPYDIFVGISAKLAGIPSVVFHSHNSDMNRKNVWEKMFMLVCKFFIPLFSDYNLACSESAAGFMFPKKILRQHQYSVLKNGICTSRFLYSRQIRTQYREKWNLQGKFVVGHVGRFTEQKNHRFLLEIFQEIKKKETESVLLLLGTGPLEEEIREMAEHKGLADSILFLGITDQVAEWMQAMDSFVLPSLYEGLPFAAIEAQACGLPVILSDRITREAKVTEPVEYISLETGAKAWAERILVYKDHPRDRNAAQQYIKQAGFDISDTAVQLLNIYRGLKG